MFLLNGLRALITIVRYNVVSIIIIYVGIYIYIYICIYTHTYTHTCNLADYMYIYLSYVFFYLSEIK